MRYRKLIGQTVAKFAGLGEDFFVGLFIQGEHKFLMLKWTQVGYIALVKDENRGGRRSCKKFGQIGRLGGLPVPLIILSQGWH